MLLATAFFGLMVFLSIAALDSDRRLPNMAPVVSFLVSGLLGLVTNPQALWRTWVWAVMAATSLAVSVLAAVMALLRPTHVDALPAMVAALAAFGGLFIDTASSTHPTSRA
ncbi:hypothetical protein [Streptantibioticus ferralitis]|uniref:Uncharacterized protein n=1 Tax=Streptantibioticus ferralitis TaxID=236510 RepID=A0ABT5YYA0_9ACTN|nr:hypothetical protein [Streptantibioticus ferralitis]MDF2256572.1 hypothetical protein [Streptantibioticus ferralitis]